MVQGAQFVLIRDFIEPKPLRRSLRGAVTLDQVHVSCSRTHLLHAGVVSSHFTFFVLHVQQPDCLVNLHWSTTRIQKRPPHLPWRDRGLFRASLSDTLDRRMTRIEAMLLVVVSRRQESMALARVRKRETEGSKGSLAGRDWFRMEASEICHPSQVPVTKVPTSFGRLPYQWPRLSLPGQRCGNWLVPTFLQWVSPSHRGRQ